jgi:hypothetical protein
MEATMGEGNEGGRGNKSGKGRGKTYAFSSYTGRRPKITVGERIGKRSQLGQERRGEEREIGNIKLNFSDGNS